MLYMLLLFSIKLVKLKKFMSCPVFPRRPSTRYMCAQKVYTYNNIIEISKQCLYKAEYLLY
jgi:hypothetical protein